MNFDSVIQKENNKDFNKDFKLCGFLTACWIFGPDFLVVIFGPDFLVVIFGPDFWVGFFGGDFWISGIQR